MQVQEGGLQGGWVQGLEGRGGIGAGQGGRWVVCGDEGKGRRLGLRCMAIWGCELVRMEGLFVHPSSSLTPSIAAPCSHSPPQLCSFLSLFPPHPPPLARQVVFHSPQQQHDFNFPFQIGSFDSMSDRPQSSQRFELAVQADDVIVMGTDGLWDNCFDEEVASVIK